VKEGGNIHLEDIVEGLDQDLETDTEEGNFLFI
jgi:hypothetical protein